jgi:Protein of unknown function (DUF2829)
MGMTFSEATEAMRDGARVRRGGWGEGAPSWLVLIPGRVIKVSYPPMTDHIAEGSDMSVADHIDAIFMPGRDTIQKVPICVVGWPLAQADLLARDWYRC